MLAAVVLAGLLVGACGGSSNSSSTSSEKSPTPSPSKAATYTVDACKLVTVTDAAAIAGTSVTSQGASAANAPICLYGSSDTNKPASVLVYAQAFADATAAGSTSPEQIAAAMNSGFGISNAKPISGIGDKAIEYNTTGGAGNGLVIVVFKANVVFFIYVMPSPDPKALETLAGTAVTRLSTA